MTFKLSAWRRLQGNIKTDLFLKKVAWTLFFKILKKETLPMMALKREDFILDCSIFHGGEEVWKYVSSYVT